MMPSLVCERISGGGLIKARWSGVSAPSTSDYIAICPNEADSSYLTYTCSPDGASDGTVDVDCTGDYYTTAGEVYVLRYYDAETDAAIAESEPFVWGDAKGSGPTADDGGAASTSAAAAAAMTVNGDGGMSPPAGGYMDLASVQADAMGILDKMSACFDLNRLDDAAGWASVYSMSIYQDYGLIGGERWEKWKAFMLKVADSEIADAPPMEFDDPRVKRKDILVSFLPMLGMFGAVPMPGVPEDAASQMIQLSLKLVANENLPATKAMAAGPLSMASTADPAKLAPYLGDLLAALRSGAVPEMLSSVMMLASHDADGVFLLPENIAFLLEQIDTLYGATVCMALQEVAKKDASVLQPHIGKFVSLLNERGQGKAALAFNLIADLAPTFPEEIAEHMEVLIAALPPLLQEQYPPFYQLAQVLGCIGRSSEARRQDVLPLLGELLGVPSILADDNGHMGVLENAKNLCGGDPGLLAPFAASAQQAAASGGPNAKQAAEEILQMLEGRDVAALHSRVDAVDAQCAELNSQISQTCHDMEAVKRYVDENMDQVREFIAGVVQKLPTPARMSVEGGSGWRVRKTIKLHFACSRQCSGDCSSMAGAEFVTETKDWSKWLKMGFSAVQAGQSMLDITSAPIDAVAGTVDAFRGIYDSYKQQDDDDFNKFISEPFLMSADRDKLIEQLRDAGFFAAFDYDAQLAGWCCKSCFLSAGLQIAAATTPAAEAASVNAPWTEQTSEDGNTYYWNTETNETRWELPVEAILPPPAPAAAAAAAAASSSTSPGRFGGLLSAAMSSGVSSSVTDDGGGDPIPECVLPQSIMSSRDVVEYFARAGVSEQGLALSQGDAELEEADTNALKAAIGVDGITGVPSDSFADYLPQMLSALLSDDIGGAVKQQIGDALDYYNAAPAPAQAALATSLEDIIQVLAFCGQYPDRFPATVGTVGFSRENNPYSGAQRVLNDLASAIVNTGQRTWDHSTYLCMCGALSFLAENVRPPDGDGGGDAAFTCIGTALAQNFLSTFSTSWWTVQASGTAAKPDALIGVLSKLMSWGNPTLSQACVDELYDIVTARPNSAQLLIPHADGIMRAATHGCPAAMTLLKPLIASNPGMFADNIDALLQIVDEDCDQARDLIGVIHGMTKSEHPSAERLVKIIVGLAADNTCMTNYDSFNCLKEMARVFPRAVYPFIKQIQFAAEAAGGCGPPGGAYARILGSAGMIGPGHASFVVPCIVEVLKNEGLDPDEAASYLGELKSVIHQDGGHTYLLDDGIGVVKRWANATGNAARRCEELMSYYEGRDVESMGLRVVHMEERVSRLNDEVNSQCANFDEVEAYMQQNIAELKEFMADIVKKLPNPCRFSVQGTMRKSILLHFKCARECGDGVCTSASGSEFTTATKEWSKWLKVGFTLLTSGKAVLDAGMGNPLGLVQTGTALVKGIYEAYNTNDGDEFDTYISQPFLTSEETDKLLNQLRGAEFFEHFQYDAQLGDWCCRSCMKHVKAPTVVANVAEARRLEHGSPAKSDTRARRGSAVAPTPFAASAASDLPTASLPSSIDQDAFRTWQAKNASVASALARDDAVDGDEDLEAALVALGLEQKYEEENLKQTFGALPVVLEALMQPAATVSSAAANVVLSRLSTWFLCSTGSYVAGVQQVVSGQLPRFSAAMAACASRDDGGSCFTGVAELACGMSGQLMQEALSSDQCDALIAAFEAVAEADFSAEHADKAEEALSHLASSMSTVLPKKRQALRSLLPVIMTALSRDDLTVSIKETLISTISLAAVNHPRLVGQHSRKLLSLCRGGLSSVTTNLNFSTYYGYDKAAFQMPENVELLINDAKTKPSLLQIASLGIFYSISTNDARPLVPFTAFFVEKLGLSSMSLMILSRIASCQRGLTRSNSVEPHLEAVTAAASTGQSYMTFYLANIYGAIGAANRDAAEQMLPKLFEMSSSGGEMFRPLVMLQVRMMAHDRELLAPHMASITATLDADAKSATIAGELIDFFEGRGIEALVERVVEVEAKLDDTEARVEDMAGNMDEVRKYIDDNMSDCKQFLATVAKKLPTPVTMTVEGKIRKRLILHFECTRNAPTQEGFDCHFPGDGRTLQTVTKDWNKWLKVGVSLFSVGKSILSIPGDGLDAVQEGLDAFAGAYDAFKSEDDDAFQTYVSQPFLTSEEQDSLLAQLKKSNFFDATNGFSYCAQTGGWVCPGCRRADERRTPDGTLVTKPLVERDVGEIGATATSDPVASAFETAKVQSTTPPPAPVDGKIKRSREEDNRSLLDTPPPPPSKSCCTVS